MVEARCRLELFNSPLRDSKKKFRVLLLGKCPRKIFTIPVANLSSRSSEICSGTLNQAEGRRENKANEIKAGREQKEK